MVTIRSYVAVDDVGKVVNPLIVEGQVHGGIDQGIAQGLDPAGGHDAGGNRLGVKGAGEAGTIASTPAVVNAIIDALRPLGVRDITMPCSPERVWRAIQAAQGEAQSAASAGEAQEGSGAA